MASGIYEIVNTVNGKRYVGSAKDFEQRWKAHRFQLDRSIHHSCYLQASWNKHGARLFEFRRLIVCEPKNLICYEQIALDAFVPVFNTARVAGSSLGLKHSAETRARLSASKMGNQHTLGHRHRPESIEKLRAKQLGVTSPTKGMKRRADAVAATATAHRGMKRSAETCAKIAAKALGRERSPESVERGAAKRRGVPLTPEHAAKLLGNKHAAGRRQTPEEKAHKSAMLKAAWAAKKLAGIPWRPPRVL